MPPSLKATLLHGSFWIFCGRSLASASGLIVLAILTRRLSPVETGTYMLMFSTSLTEVHLVIESEKEILGLEIKSGKRVGPGETSGLRSLSEMIPPGRRFRGMVAYTGPEIQDLGSGYRAYPYRDLVQELAETK